MGFNTGALFSSLTTTKIVSDALRVGEPLSVTRTVMEFVLGPCASVGVHVKTPVDGLMAAPGGTPASKLKVRDCVGISGSEADAVNVSSVPSFTVRLPILERTGGLFTSVTTTVNDLASLW